MSWLPLQKSRSNVKVINIPLMLEQRVWKYEPHYDKTNKMTVALRRRISLGIRPVWSESSPCAQWVAKDPSFLQADSEDSDQTGRMPRLIWVFAGRTCHFVGFVMRQLIYTCIHNMNTIVTVGEYWTQMPGLTLGLRCMMYRQTDRKLETYCKTLKYSDNDKISVIILKIEQCGSTTE